MTRIILLVASLSPVATAAAALLLAEAAVPATALSRHVPNPKPRHPHGKPPEGRRTDKAERELERVRNFVIGGGEGDGASGSDCCGADGVAPAAVGGLRTGGGGTSSSRPHVLIDGNNVRGALGHDLSDASDLTHAVGRWWADIGSGGGADGADGTLQVQQNQPAVAIVWDGGGVEHPTASMLRPPPQLVIPGSSPSPSPPVVAVFSGSELSADDIMVQLCGYLDDSRGIGTAHTPPEVPVAVFTSDADLASRCAMQRSGNGGCPDAVRVFHSVYLAWMVQDICNNRSVGGRNDDRCDADDDPPQCKTAQAAVASPIRQRHRHLTVPDWEGAERRDQARALRLELGQLLPDDDEAEPLESIPFSSGASSDGGGTNSPPRRTWAASGALLQWFATGCSGLSIGRVTKRGSVLYELEETIGHHLSLHE